MNDDGVAIVTLRIPRNLRAFMVTTAMDHGRIEQASDIHPLVDAITDTDVQVWVASLFSVALTAAGATEVAVEFSALNE